MKNKQTTIDDLKEMIYKLQKECAEKTDNILALGEQLKTAETVIEILEAKIGGHEYAISDIVKEYQGKLDKLKEENDTLFKAIEEVNKINKRLESENEELKKQLESTKGLVTVGNRQLAEALEGYNDLKNELHSKVEFIQEQRNVIDEYSKEIEMYKKCQGSRASKREEKLKQTLAEIKEIINEFAKEDILTFPDFSKEQNYKLIQKQCGEPILKILQKINEVEDEKNM